jgi:hypothetical protein
MSTGYRYLIAYQFRDQLHEYTLDWDQPVLALHVAAWHLLQLHFGDAENSLIMPGADALAAQVLEQAKLLGITGINSRLIG